MTSRHAALALLALLALLLDACAVGPHPASAVAPADGLTFDFARFDEAEWLAVRDPAVPALGHFLQRDGYIENAIRPEDRGSQSLEAGHALRLLKGHPFRDGRVEAELLLDGKAAPSLYFRTRLGPDGTHRETYNLVVYDFSGPDRRDYHGLNLWKWQESWPADARSWKHWRLLASWSFPVPSQEKVVIAAVAEGPEIKVFYNGRLKGSAYDADPLREGLVGICSCEGVNRFYRFRLVPAP